jgi:hypothetical protein
MQEPSTPRMGKTLAQTESAIHSLLILPEEQRPWSLHEVCLEMGDPGFVGDAVRSLQGCGLIHRLDDFVWATRAALAADGIAI